MTDARQRWCRRHQVWVDTCGSCTAAQDHNARLYAGTTPAQLRTAMRAPAGR